MDPYPRPGTWRERLYVIIFHTYTPAGRLFDTLLLAVIMASLGVVMLDSIQAIHLRYGSWLYGLEWIFTALFALEYLLRVLCAPRPREYVFSFYGLIDLLAVLPAFIALIVPDAQYLLVIRVLRMMRVFRVLKLTPYLSQADFLMVALSSSRQKITVFLLAICTLVTMFGTFMYVIEGPANGFTSIPRSIYWAVVTLTTVGFGDMVPKTALGQTLAGMIMITGYSIIAVPTGIFTAELANAMRSATLQRDCPHCQKPSHEPDSSFCNRCGSPLFPRPETNRQDESAA